MAYIDLTFGEITGKGANFSPGDIVGLPTIPSNAVIESVIYTFNARRNNGANNKTGEVFVYICDNRYSVIDGMSRNTDYSGSFDLTRFVRVNNGVLSYLDGSNRFSINVWHDLGLLGESSWVISNNKIRVTYNVVDNARDLNFDNLLSFTAWASSPSSSVAPGCSGTITTDKINGTVISQGTGDFYTLYYTGDSSLYYIPVQAGQQYLFRFDADVMGGVQAYVFYFNDSYAVVNNASGVYYDGMYGKNNLYFTPPSGCTKITFRIGTTDGSRVVFSNLAIYKTSWNTHEITNRQYRKVFNAGQELGILYVPERPGYVFQGWYTGENGAGQHIRKIDTLSANTTVYSYWKKRDYYDVNYDNLFSFSDWAYSPSGSPNGLSDSAYIGTITTDIPNGTVTVNGADPNGSAFYTMYGSFSPYHHIPVQEGQQYVFRYTVSQTYNMQAFVFFCNDNQDFVTDPSTGLQFVFDTNGNHLVFVPPSGCTNVCFRLGVGGINTAVFSNIGLYKVSNEQGITNRPIRKNIAYGSTVGTLSTPSREGYAFQGWYTGENGAGAEIKSSDSFIKGVTAYSAWLKLHTVTFKDENGATLKTEAVADGSTVTAPADPVKADTAQHKYTFDGWYDANGNKWYPNTAITGETVYTARFNSTVQRYTVKWYNEDGSVLLETDDGVPYGDIPDYNGATPTKAETAAATYEHIGWSIDVNSSGPTELTAVIEAVDYYARFRAINKTYTVVWKNDDGTVLETDTAVAYDTTPDYNGSVPTKDDERFNYTFLGWSANVEDPPLDDTELPTVTGNITYTAVYEKTPKIFYVTVTMLTDKDDILGEYLIRVTEYGRELVIEAEENAGYRFVKWTDGNTDSSRTITVTASVDYKAIYERVPVPIIVNEEQRVTGVYIVPSTQTIVYVISGEVPTVEADGVTVDDWNFEVSNSVPGNSYPLEKLYINETRIW